MKVRRVFTVLVMGVLMSTVSLANESQEKMAVAAAERWLALVDSAEFDESWEQAATYFRDAVPKSQWEQMAKAVRTPLGALVSRELESAKYTGSLPGAPDGQYVVIQFSSSFENKKSAIETVTPMMDGDGEWRVSGYFIK